MKRLAIGGVLFAALALAGCPKTVTPPIPPTPQPYSVHLTWTEAALGPVTGYMVYRDGESYASVVAPAQSFVDVDVPVGPHFYGVKACNAATAICSDESNVQTATIP